MRAVLFGAVLWLGALGATGCLIDLPQEEREQGYTACGDFLSEFGETNYCQPGQYCADATFSECVEGCLSNENCASDQRCVKGDGYDVGTCQNAVKKPASQPR